MLHKGIPQTVSEEKQVLHVNKEQDAATYTVFDAKYQSKNVITERQVSK